MIFEAVLFDLDDTLHDRSKTLSKFIDIFIKKYAYTMDYASISRIKDIICEIDFHGYKPREEMFNELQNRVSWKIKPDISDLLSFWNSEFPKCAEPAKNLYSVLEYILSINIKMGIVTNGYSEIQNIKIDKLDLRKYMETIIISEEVGVRKPDSEIFDIALSRINSTKEKTLFIGDNPANDIKGAIDAGLMTVWLSYGKMWSEENYTPKYIVKEIHEIIELFGGCT